MKLVMQTLVLSIFLVVSPSAPVQAQDSLDASSAEIPNLETRQQQRQTNINQKQAQMEAKRQELETIRQERSDAKCEQITARINNRISRYEENKDKWHNRFYGIKERVISLTGKLEANGCDTSAVKTDIETFETLLEDFAAAFRLFHSSLQGTRAYVCSETDVDFSTQLTQAQNELIQVKATATNLKNFVDTTLKPHLKQTATTCQNTSMENIQP